jgi:hypothetical protein
VESIDRNTLIANYFIPFLGHTNAGSLSWGSFTGLWATFIISPLRTQHWSFSFSRLWRKADQNLGSSSDILQPCKNHLISLNFNFFIVTYGGGEGETLSHRVIVVVKFQKAIKALLLKCLVYS